MPAGDQLLGLRPRLLEALAAQCRDFLVSTEQLYENVADKLFRDRVGGGHRVHDGAPVGGGDGMIVIEAETGEQFATAWDGVRGW